jgi:hypothetical protein
VEVQNLKFRGVPPHPFEHKEMMRKGVRDTWIEPQCPTAARHQIGFGDRIPTGE